MKKRSRFLVSLLMSLAFTVMTALPLFAQGFTAEETGINETAKSAGFSINLSCANESGNCIPYIIGSVVKALLGIFGSLFLILILYGGFQYMTSQGDKTRVEAAKKTITSAIVGMLIVSASYAISNFVLDSVSGIVSGSETVSTE